MIRGDRAWDGHVFVLVVMLTKMAKSHVTLSLSDIQPCVGMIHAHVWSHWINFTKEKTTNLLFDNDFFLFVNFMLLFGIVKFI